MTVDTVLFKPPVVNVEGTIRDDCCASRGEAPYSPLGSSESVSSNIPVSDFMIVSAWVCRVDRRGGGGVAPYSPLGSSESSSSKVLISDVVELLEALVLPLDFEMPLEAFLRELDGRLEDLELEAFL